MLGQLRIKITLTNVVFPFFLPLSYFKLFGLKFSKSNPSLTKNVACAVLVIPDNRARKNYNGISAERWLWVGMYPWLFLWQAAQAGHSRSLWKIAAVSICALGAHDVWCPRRLGRASHEAELPLQMWLVEGHRLSEDKLRDVGQKQLLDEWGEMGRIISVD